MAADRRYKICLLGEGRVGKTSILLRYIRNAFDDKQVSTLSASCFDKSVSLGAGESVRVSIWDTAGQERFHALGPLYYRDADGALLVYDITDEASFTRVRDWVKELRKMLGEDISIALVGNKSDMEKSRTVDKVEADAYAVSVGALHVMASAKAGTGVNEAFSGLMRKIVAKQRAMEGTGKGAKPSAPRQRIAIVDDEPTKREGGGGGCCGGAAA